jgi:hypothetical protein
MNEVRENVNLLRTEFDSDESLVQNPQQAGWTVSAFFIKFTGHKKKFQSIKVFRIRISRISAMSFGSSPILSRVVFEIVAPDRSISANFIIYPMMLRRFQFFPISSSPLSIIVQFTLISGKAVLWSHLPWSIQELWMPSKKLIVNNNKSPVNHERVAGLTSNLRR